MKRAYAFGTGLTAWLLARNGFFGSSEWTVPNDCKVLTKQEGMFSTGYTAYLGWPNMNLPKGSLIDEIDLCDPIVFTSPNFVRPVKLIGKNVPITHFGSPK